MAAERPGVATHLPDNYGRELRFDKLDWDDKVSIIRRCGSFWTRKQADGWDAIIFVEPLVPITTNIHGTFVRAHRYNHGYCDTSPWPASLGEAIRQVQESTRMSEDEDGQRIFDDIQHYWTRRSSPSDRRRAVDDPRYCAAHLCKVATAQWIVAAEYLWSKVCHLEMQVWEFELSSSTHGLSKQNKSLAENIKESNQWRRKINWLIDWLQTGLEALGIHRDGNGLDEDNSLSDGHPLSSQTQRDFLLILAKLKASRDLLDAHLNAVMGIAQLLQAESSVKEAERSTKQTKVSTELTKLSTRLAYLGLVFIPLSYAASMLSMNDKFQPGQQYFWVYWLIAAPLCAFLFLMWSIWKWKDAQRPLNPKLERPKNKQKTNDDAV
ncbi:hypothetical protein QBC47DRAFT_97084 [Echria macrotheca]|uniref:Uncharacterized protein n=1 Tax=Echria macrotheca TaxID=438768 RepID=A0AAJ0BKT9_9PEZI|nr:hypothetical protein QBC47DRAFT_97084 [Echria macrotheca]